MSECCFTQTPQRTGVRTGVEETLSDPLSTATLKSIKCLFPNDARYTA